MIEGLGFRAALRRSRALASGNGWRILAVMLLPLFIYVPVIFGVQHLAQAAGLPVRLAQLAGEIIGIFATPFFGCIAVLLYYDVRIRKEGYDLEVALRATTAPPIAPAASGS